MNITIELPASSLNCSAEVDADYVRDAAAALRVAVNLGATMTPHVFALPLITALEKFAQRTEVRHE